MTYIFLVLKHFILIDCGGSFKQTRKAQRILPRMHWISYDICSHRSATTGYLQLPGICSPLVSAATGYLLALDYIMISEVPEYLQLLDIFGRSWISAGAPRFSESNMVNV